MALLLMLPVVLLTAVLHPSEFAAAEVDGSGVPPGVSIVVDQESGRSRQGGSAGPRKCPAGTNQNVCWDASSGFGTVDVRSNLTSDGTSVTSQQQASAGEAHAVLRMPFGAAELTATPTGRVDATGQTGRRAALRTEVQWMGMAVPREQLLAGRERTVTATARFSYDLAVERGSEVRARLEVHGPSGQCDAARSVRLEPGSHTARVEVSAQCDPLAGDRGRLEVEFSIIAEAKGASAGYHFDARVHTIRVRGR